MLGFISVFVSGGRDVDLCLDLYFFGGEVGGFFILKLSSFFFGGGYS